jgi:IclR family acetate operon transcriptional repressor
MAHYLGQAQGRLTDAPACRIIHSDSEILLHNMTRSLSGVQSVLRAIRLLKMFTDAHPEWRLKDLARAVEMNKATTYRLLSALEAEGLLMRDARTGAYRLGPEIIALGGRALRSNDLRSAGYAELEWLACAAGEAATLEILVDDQVLILEEIPASHLVAPWQTIGTRHPAHATSTGKLLLAFLPPHERVAHLRPPLQRLTEKTITDLEALEQQMALIRAQGYATAIEELEDGYVAVSAPVRNHDGEVVAAISIGGPITRLNAGRLTECIALVRQAGRRISERLGFREYLSESA